jgi:hypothetical protein
MSQTLNVSLVVGQNVPAKIFNVDVALSMPIRIP